MRFEKFLLVKNTPIVWGLIATFKTGGPNRYKGKQTLEVGLLRWG
jgi:hypothetical protein